MAGSQGFQNGMKKAAGGPQLIGADAWDRQVGRESAQKDNAAVQGSTGASNLADYINVSKSATQGNNSFSIDNANKYVNSSRDQSNKSKADNAGFSNQRREENVNFGNKQMDNNLKRNEGFSMNTTKEFMNNAKESREDNTEKATKFADQTIDKYLEKNKQWQAIDVAALDRTVRQSAGNSKAQGVLEAKNTYGDMYSYGRKELPAWQRGESMKGVETPDFQGMYNQTKKDLDSYSV
jgi:hypothetical protein